MGRFFAFPTHIGSELRRPARLVAGLGAMPGPSALVVLPIALFVPGWKSRCVRAARGCTTAAQGVSPSLTDQRARHNLPAAHALAVEFATLAPPSLLRISIDRRTKSQPAQFAVFTVLSNYFRALMYIAKQSFSQK